MIKELKTNSDLEHLTMFEICYIVSETFKNDVDIKGIREYINDLYLTDESKEKLFKEIEKEIYVLEYRKNILKLFYNTVNDKIETDEYDLVGNISDDYYTDLEILRNQIINIQGESEKIWNNLQGKENIHINSFRLIKEYLKNYI